MSMAGFPTSLMTDGTMNISIPKGTFCRPPTMGQYSACFSSSYTVSWASHWPLWRERCPHLLPIYSTKSTKEPSWTCSWHPAGRTNHPQTSNTIWVIPKGQSDLLLLLTDNIRLLLLLSFCAPFLPEKFLHLSVLNTHLLTDHPTLAIYTLLLTNSVLKQHATCTAQGDTQYGSGDEVHRNHIVGYSGWSVLLILPQTLTLKLALPLSLLSANTHSG